MNKDQHQIEAQKDAEYLAAVRHRHEERQNSARMLRRRQTALENVSWVFNAVSVVTAAYFVISLAGNYPGAWAFILALVMFALLVLNELGKRYAIVEGAEGARAWFVVVAVLVGVSVYTSYNGGEKFTVEMATTPPAEHNPAIDSLTARIAAVDADIATWKRQTWKGKIVTDARKGISRLEETKAALIAQRSALESRDLERNDGKEGEHLAEVRQFGNVFGVVAGAMDLLLIACLLIAKNDEHNARRLIGLNESERTNANVRANAERTNERERRTPPNAVPNAVPSPAADVAALEANQRMARKLAELREENEQLKRMREQEAERKANEQTERSANVRANANERTNEQRTNAANKTERTNTPPKWVAQAKAMRASGMSYDEIAAKVEKSKSTVHKWVNS